MVNDSCREGWGRAAARNRARQNRRETPIHETNSIAIRQETSRFRSVCPGEHVSAILAHVCVQNRSTFCHPGRHCFATTIRSVVFLEATPGLFIRFCLTITKLHPRSALITSSSL